MEKKKPHGNRNYLISHEMGNEKCKVLACDGPQDATCQNLKIHSTPPLTSLIPFFRTPIQVNFMSFPNVFTMRTQPRSPFLQTPAQKI